MIDVDLTEMAPRQQLEALLDGQIDLAFVGQMESDAFRMLDFEAVIGIGLRLALPRKHRLAKLQYVPIPLLEQESFVIFKRSAAPGIHEFLLDLCRSAGFEPNVVKQSDRAQSLLDLVAAGVGVSIVPELFARYQTDVALRQLAPRPPKIRLCMAWRKADKSPALHVLRKTIRRELQHRIGGTRRVGEVIRP